MGGEGERRRKATLGTQLVFQRHLLGTQLFKDRLKCLGVGGGGVGREGGDNTARILCVWKQRKQTRS